MKQTITLSQVSGKWMATFSNPKIAAPALATIPTEYTTRTCAEVVQEAMQRLNPDCSVVVSNKIDKAAFLSSLNLKGKPIMTYEITGSDVTKIEPVNGVIHVGGIIKTPTQLIKIKWEVDCTPGETICEAYDGQYEIDCLVKGGCKILSVALY